MDDQMYEPPLDLSALRGDAEMRARRIVAGVSQRIGRDRARDGVERMLARWASPAALAAAASAAAVLLPNHKREPDAFAAFVVPAGPAAVWVAKGGAPNMAAVANFAEINQ